MNGILKRMKGEELLTLAVSGNTRVRHEVNDELDRRAWPVQSESDRVRDFWAGRNLAMRKSAALAA